MVTLADDTFNFVLGSCIAVLAFKDYFSYVQFSTLMCSQALLKKLCAHVLGNINKPEPTIVLSNTLKFKTPSKHIKHKASTSTPLSLPLLLTLGQVALILSHWLPLMKTSVQSINSFAYCLWFVFVIFFCFYLVYLSAFILIGYLQTDRVRIQLANHAKHGRVIIKVTKSSNAQKEIQALQMALSGYFHFVIYHYCYL